jgi:hypothetical protein
MLTAAGDVMAYDGDNRLKSVNGVTYVYGPDGRRLKKTVGGTTTLYLGADVEKTVRVRRGPPCGYAGDGEDIGVWLSICLFRM